MKATVISLLENEKKIVINVLKNAIEELKNFEFGRNEKKVAKKIKDIEMILRKIGEE